jgi:hypothetical protein
VVDGWGRRSSPPDKATLLKQYELIRSEVTASLQLQQQILGFGLATVGLLAGAALVGKTQPFRSALLVMFVPLVCYLAVMIWFSEVMRMLRAGGFLLTVEKKLDTCGDGSLEWEYGVAKSRLRHGLLVPDPDRLRLYAVTALFFTLAGESIMLGWNHASTFARTFALVAGPVAAIVLRLLAGLRVGEWNDLLDVDPEARRVAADIRVLGACRRILGGPGRLAQRLLQRPAVERRDRLVLKPLAASNA